MTGSNAKRKLLIVEDDADTRQLLAMGLSRAGYDVTIAEDGEKATAVLEAAVPDIVLIDLMMPRMDGIRLLEWIRQSLGPQVRAVVFSSSNTKELTEQVAKLGATFVVKPVRLPALLKTLEGIGA